MKFDFKEMPHEASLFFLPWIWIIVSIFGMTVVNTLFPGNDPAQNISHAIAAAIYLFPAVCIGLKIRQNRKIAGLPLFICAVIIGIRSIVFHLRLMNPGMIFDFISAKPDQTEVIMMILLTAAVPLSFCMFAQSTGCKEARNMKILKIFGVFDYFALTIIYMTGMTAAFAYSTIPVWLFLYELLISPLLGILYIQMMTVPHRKKNKRYPQNEIRY